MYILVAIRCKRILYSSSTGLVEFENKLTLYNIFIKCRHAAGMRIDRCTP